MAHPQGGSSFTMSRSNWHLELLVSRRGENRGAYHLTEKSGWVTQWHNGKRFTSSVQNRRFPDGLNPQKRREYS